MSNIATEEEPFFNNQELQAKVKSADPILKEYVSELKKENARIQKLRAKEEAQNESEQRYLREQIANLANQLATREKVTVVIDNRAEESTHK